MSYQLQSSLFQPDNAFPEQEPNITYIPGFLNNQEFWFDQLRSTLIWNTRFKSRHTVTFGVTYNPGTGLKAVREMPEFLGPVCQQINDTFNYNPNNCLINHYPDGDHYISFHSDKDTEMKAQTGVTILSLGSVRTMALRNINNPKLCFHYPLAPGSVFYMKDALQLEWQHGIAKEPESGPRISLSFRSLISD